VFQPVLPLHECANPTIAESVVAKSAAEPLHSIADSATAESATEPLQFVADSAAAGTALTKTL
jgi:hypothetical protein